MAEMITADPGGGKRRGVRKMKRHSLKTDMTPMVDLGFLLIAFFIFTAQLSEPRVVNLNMPKEGGPPTTLAQSNALTILLEKDNTVFYYEGQWEDARVNGRIYKTGFSVSNGIGNIIRQKQKQLDA